MALFSKEYCLKHMFWEDEKETAIEFSDFCIEDLEKELLPWNYIDIICEGYWFNGLAKDKYWVCYALYGNGIEACVKIEELDEFIEKWDKKYYHDMNSIE